MRYRVKFERYSSPFLTFLSFLKTIIGFFCWMVPFSLFSLFGYIIGLDDVTMGMMGGVVVIAGIVSYLIFFFAFDIDEYEKKNSKVIELSASELFFKNVNTKISIYEYSPSNAKSCRTILLNALLKKGVFDEMIKYSESDILFLIMDTCHELLASDEFHLQDGELNTYSEASALKNVFFGCLTDLFSKGYIDIATYEQKRISFINAISSSGQNHQLKQEN